jgi:hypothetical protein
MNPFEVGRCVITSPHPPEGARTRLGTLLREGFEAGGRHHPLFGGIRGRHLSMSFGVPVLGGGAPVLRARLRPGARSATFDVSIGARLELVLLAGAWGLVTVAGGGLQLLLQLREVLAGRAGWSAVTDVLPGIGIMAGILVLGTWLFRRRAKGEGDVLLLAFREAVDGSAASVPPPAPLPSH